MLRKILLQLKTRHLQSLHEQKGQGIIIFTFAFIGLIAMLGLALDLGLVYIEKVKVNRAADAAALAAVVELPYEQDTMNRAIEYIHLNGYEVGVDTEILVRGCVVSNTTYVATDGTTKTYNVGTAGNKGEPTFTPPMTRTNLITGALYIPATQQPPRATFVVDTGGYQASGNSCGGAGNILGTANRLRVAGQVNVRMNFMQFFGFGQVPVADEAVAENLSSLDVVIVFDVSGSMEDQTICHDCWVRSNYNPDFPNNGYFNPLPYNPLWATPGTGNFNIPLSQLCTAVTPSPHLSGTLKYLTVEAELYSRAQGNWRLNARTPGQGFWAIQRASKDTSVATNPLGEGNDQRTAAGNVNLQSSNVCGPNVTGNQIDCTVGAAGAAGDNVCSSVDGGRAVDCSAYIAARPFESYGQYADSQPGLNGAAYNFDCFTNSGGVGSLSGTCWSSPASNPFVATIGTGPSNVPFVEYDFTPTWTQTTYIWIRAIGGGDLAYTWAGLNPAQIPGDPDGNPNNNVTAWKKVIYWQVDNGVISESNNSTLQSPATWRDNRAQNTHWRWIRLGSTATTTGTQYTFRLYQGSAGYKVDKIVFTNDSASSPVPGALRRRLDGVTISANNDGTAVGPPASLGSATREACNLCNPAYGLTVSPNQCTCKLGVNDLANGGYGSGQGCTLAPITGTNQLADDLYSGLQPIRSAQEAVKNFARKLDPKFDQLGIVGFTAGGDNTNAQSDNTRRSKLQCLQRAQVQFGNAARCYDPSLGTPLTYTNVLSAVEKHWPQAGTNIAIGMREGLEELGLPGFATNSNCDISSVTNGSACDRRGAARRVIILMTDGAPNDGGSLCDSVPNINDYWQGLVGSTDRDFDCPVYYAKVAADNDVTVYTIGIGSGANQDLLTAMAEGYDPHGDEPDISIFTNAKGKFFPAAKPSDLDLIFDQILSNIYVRIVS